MTANHSQRPGIDAFHKERSKCVDAFSELEDAVIGLLSAIGSEGKAESFGQKLSKLTKAKPSPQMSKSALAKLPALLKRCDEICGIRNDIVHARLKLAVIGDDHRACFVNLRECDKSSQTARLFTLEGMRKLSVSMIELANDLRSLRASPASSPPPPSRDAAGGP